MDPSLEEAISAVKESFKKNLEKLPAESPSKEEDQEITYEVLDSESKEEQSTLDRFLKERKLHRNILFYFALAMSVLSLLFLATLIGVQIFMRITANAYFEVISDRGIEIIAVAIFGEIFGVVYVIARAIWSNDEFKMANK